MIPLGLNGPCLIPVAKNKKILLVLLLFKMCVQNRDYMVQRLRKKFDQAWLPKIQKIIAKDR